jgi:hypothetical protein
MIRASFVTTGFLALLELLGARHHVSALSGTVTSSASLFPGLLYALTFFTVVVVVPPMLVTGLAGRLLTRPSRGGSRPPAPS